jgi:hypothetical protein
VVTKKCHESLYFFSVVLLISCSVWTHVIVANERSEVEHQKLLETWAMPTKIWVDLDQLKEEYVNLEMTLTGKGQAIEDKKATLDEDD